MRNILRFAKRRRVAVLITTVLGLFVLYNRPKAPVPGLGQGGSTFTARSHPLPGVTCWDNPKIQRSGATAPMCNPTPRIVHDDHMWQTIATDYSPMLGFSHSESDVQYLADALQRHRGECFYLEPFAALLTQSSPPYNICQRMISGAEAGEPRTIYVPSDTSESIADADCLPHLMRLVLPDGKPGVVADVGASSGNTAFPLLANGHTVHLYEKDLDQADNDDRAFIHMTVAVNLGWANRIHLHGLVASSGPRSLDGTLAQVERLHLLKIDVDDIDPENAVFDGAVEVLQRTDLVQIEMIETGVTGIWRRQKYMDKAGFDLYALHGIVTDENNQDVEHAAYCSGDAAILWKSGESAGSMAGARGQTVVEYGAYALTSVQLEAMCNQCDRSCRELNLATNCREFVFVRRGTETASRVQAHFGNCEQKVL